MQLVTTNVSEKVHLEEYFHLDKPVVLKSGYKPQMNFFFFPFSFCSYELLSLCHRVIDNRDSIINYLI